MDDPGTLSLDKVMLHEDDDSDVQVEEAPKLLFGANHEAKLKELLHNINALEIKICSAATKEFIKLLKGESGGELLRLYVLTSNSFSELMQAWKLRQGKPGMSYIFSLISAILSHPEGMYTLNDKDRVVISRVIDKFARMIINEKMDDIYKELNSKEGKHQSVSLKLMASIIRRGSGLASEVVKNFDFKLQGFSKLAEYKHRGSDKKRKHSTRKSFVMFAMSFLEVGKPGLLRWVLQQKEMYSGVLRGLGNDEDDVVVYVLSTLQDRVLTTESLVPPGLRSVLFGSFTLEQLVSISGRENEGPASELAHSVLITVCTDPSNGLMPDLKRLPNPLRGNPKRLLGVMKKLKPTEFRYHRDLLLAILRGRPFLASSYMKEFPYNIEDFASPNWFAIVSLAANLISSVETGLSFDFLDTESCDPPSFDNPDVQSILNCICSRPFSRSAINKGLLHSDFLVKHGTLRLLWEAMKLLDSFVSALQCSSCSSSQMKQSWTSLIQEICDEVRTLLPDPQVLLTLLSFQNNQSRSCESHFKRKAESTYLLDCSSKGRKKLKREVANEDTDIIISGVSFDAEITQPTESKSMTDSLIKDDLDSQIEFMKAICEIWSLDLCLGSDVILNDADIYFHTKLLDTLKIYLRLIPTGLEGSFDFFMNLLSDPLALPINLQSSLLSLLSEYIDWSAGSGIPVRTPPLMYKHLQPFLNLLICSPINEIKNQAYSLAWVAILSTGAFDRNIQEIGAWFLFLPGYCRNKWCIEDQPAVQQSMSRVVISFLCDAISTIGNNLFKYWAMVEQHIHLKGFKDLSPNFSPVIVCVLQKCLRLLYSESGTFSLSEKSMISLYVSNTLKYLLQTQVDAVPLSALIDSSLSEGLKDRFSVDDDSGGYLCEWRPLKNLLLFSQGINCQQALWMLSIDQKAMPADGSFVNTLSEVKKIVSSGNGVEIVGIIEAFSSAVLCTAPDQLLKNFPLVMTISQSLLRVPFSLLSSIIFLEQGFLASVSKLLPEMFFSSLEMATSMIHCDGTEFDCTGIPASSFAEEVPCDIDFDAIESAAGAFSLFLKQAPFHVLFPAIMSASIHYLPEPSKVQDLFLAKLSNLRSDCLISYLRLVLFWFYQIQLSYKIEPVAELYQLSEICLNLVKNVFSQLVVKPNSECPTNAKFNLSANNVQEVVETVLCHPAVLASLSFPLSCNEELPMGNLGHNLETLLSLSQQSIHKIDHHVLDMLSTTLDYLLSSCTDQYSILEGGAGKPLVKAFNTLVQRLFLEFREKFDLSIGTENVWPLLPAFYALHALIRFISPFELLELVHWMFQRVDVNELSISKSCNVGFCIAGGTFEALSSYLLQPIAQRVLYDLLWETEGKSFDINHIKEIYVKVCTLATNFDLDFADICLLKVVNAIYSQNQIQQQSLHPLSLVMSMVVARTPMEMISHCVCRTTTTKAKLLFLLTGMSSLHLSVFGKLLLDILDKDSLFTENQIQTHSQALSDEELMMLLPAALSYLNSSFLRFDKQYRKYFLQIPSFYSRKLLRCFCHWSSFVSGSIFQEEHYGSFPSTIEELLSLVNDSLLGKAVRMFQYNFALSGDSVETKSLLKLFNSIFPCSGAHVDLFDCDLNEIKCNSFNQSLDLINRVVAKVSLSRMLLFPEDNQVQFLPEADGCLKEFSLESGSDEQNSARLQFMKILVGGWQLMVKKLPSTSNSSKRKTSPDCLSLYKYLEVFILRSILEITAKMLDSLTELQSIPFLEQLIRSALLYRFEDSATLKMVQHVLTLLSEGKFSHVLYLQLLLAHSQFATVVQPVSISSNAVTGVFLKPMSSILRLLVTPPSNSNAADDKTNAQTKSKLHVNQSEVVKLLRTLLQIKPLLHGSDFGKDNGINLRELQLLLLSSYGASLSETDIEIHNVMREIELVDKSDNQIAELDYLWGSAAIKVRKERTLEQDTSCNIMTDTEAVKERHRSQFRENLPLDPKICALTVLYFPYDRTAGDEPSSSNKLQPDNLKNMYETHPSGIDNIQRYDPVFILRFAIHSLSVGFIEPFEFAGLGLLAIAFASISSPDVGMRKLGYETLGRFKNELECQKKKDVMRLRLLLTYVQNGIEEPWQRIPSVIALFAAETSVILLDASHDHYTTLNKYLTHFSRVNMKFIPLFHEFFLSSSINFRTERLWILRLLYAGLNLEDDAQIYIRNSILETLLSFFASPLSDNESKGLILLIVKKSVKLHKLACYLVEYCGLFSWFSSLLSVFNGVLIGDEKRFLLGQLALVMEVVNDVISSRNITEWLQRHALEQLIDFSSHLYKLLVGGMELMRENVPLVNSIILILTSTLKISQKRKIYQPHFTLSLGCLFQIYQAVNMYNTARSSVTAELGLKAILMSMPPVDIFYANQEKLSSFLSWAVSTALKADSGQMCELEESGLHIRSMLEDGPFEESMTSKLLRWLLASVIFGKLFGKLHDPSSKLLKRSYDTLQSLLEDFEKRREGINKTRFDCEEILAASIFYLQQLLGMRCRVLPSVVSALSLLLLCDVSECADDFKLAHRTSLASLWSRIRCPEEANASWRWSFYQPWKDLSLESTDIRKVDELQACQTLLVIISNVLAEKSLDSQVLSHQDAKISNVFEWERSITETK